MEADFFDQKIPSEPCPGCRKRDDIIAKQEELIEFQRLQIRGYEYDPKKLRIFKSEIEQLKNQL